MDCHFSDFSLLPPSFYVKLILTLYINFVNFLNLLNIKIFLSTYNFGFRIEKIDKIVYDGDDEMRCNDEQINYG